MELIKYLADALLNVVLLLSAGILPWLITALVMQVLSTAVRSSVADLMGIKPYIFLTAPGVMIHELSHALFCLIFGHEITDMVLFSPENDGTLGYVNHRYNPDSIYQRIGNFFIGTGPVWGGILVLHLLTRVLLPQFEYTFASFAAMAVSLEFWGSWKSWLWLYLAFSIISHITLSREDLQGAANGFAVILGMVLVLCIFFGWMGNWEAWCIDGLWRIFTGFLPLLLSVIGFTLILTVLFRSLGKRR